MQGDRGSKWWLPALLFLEGSSYDPWLSRPCSEMSKEPTLLCAAEVFQSAVSLWVICPAVSSWAGTPLPNALPTLLEQTLLIFFFFKFQALSPTSYKNLMRFGPFCLQRQIWGFVFPIWAPQCDSLFFHAHGSLPIANSHSLFHSQAVSACPIFFDVASSLLLAELLLPVFRSSSRLFLLMGVFSSCIHRMRRT